MADTQTGTDRVHCDQCGAFASPDEIGQRDPADSCDHYWQPVRDPLADLPSANQYLAWDGEAEGYTIVTVDKIRKDLAQFSASGVRMWTRFALIGPRAASDVHYRGRTDAHGDLLRGATAGWPETWPVEVRCTGRSSHDDYVTETFVIVTPYGEIKDWFSATHDGRA